MRVAFGVVAGVTWLRAESLSVGVPVLMLDASLGGLGLGGKTAVCVFSFAGCLVGREHQRNRIVLFTFVLRIYPSQTHAAQNKAAGG